MTCESINQQAGCKLFFKCENFQKGGAFKTRGAVNAFILLKERYEREGKELKGVTTSSTGNHAIALSYISGKFNVKNKIVMAENSPAIK